MKVGSFLQQRGQRAARYASHKSRVKTDEYCLQLHLEVSERNIPFHPEGQRFKSPW